MQDFPGGGGQLQPVNWPNIPENCMKKEKWAGGADRFPTANSNFTDLSGFPVNLMKVSVRLGKTLIYNVIRTKSRTIVN